MSSWKFRLVDDDLPLVNLCIAPGHCLVNCLSYSATFIFFVLPFDVRILVRTLLVNTLYPYLVLVLNGFWSL